MQHAWTFVAGSKGSNHQSAVVLVAVCSNCGLHTSEVVAPRRSGHVDLTGDCGESERTVPVPMPGMVSFSRKK